MPTNYIQGGFNRQRNQPDIRDIISLLQYMSPERQQEQQLQLEATRAGLEEARARTGISQQELDLRRQLIPSQLEEQQARTRGLSLDNNQKEASGPLTLDELRARIGAQNAERKQAEVGTNIAQSNLDYLPTQHNQATELHNAQVNQLLQNLSFAKEEQPFKVRGLELGNTLLGAQAGHLTNEDSIANAAEGRATQLFPTQLAQGQTQLDALKQQMGFAAQEEPGKLALSSAQTNHINAETDLASHDPERAMKRLMFAHQAMANPKFASIVADSDPLVGAGVQNEKDQQDKALQGVTDAVGRLHSPAQQATGNSVAFNIGHGLNTFGHSLIPDPYTAEKGNAAAGKNLDDLLLGLGALSPEQYQNNRRKDFNRYPHGAGGTW